ncbi:MAG: MliC family protein, partial [Candidatus Pacebacteria bacterium]|nr:MliC family protein [Candidatus Paceibacterota bacterium]
MAKYIVGIIFIILLTGAGYYFFAMGGSTKTPLNTVSYVCAENKTISAAYYADSVDIVLSDGRNFSLPQAMSASGARYASADESIVFWNKGNEAFITEGGNPENMTFKNCGEGAPTAPTANIFTNASSTFSVQYPTGWTPD